MKTDLHLVFPGNCREAFAFYSETFSSPIVMTMTYGDAPGEAPVPPDSKHLIMHTSMNLGTMLFMGCDAPAAPRVSFGGFQVSLELSDEAEIKRLYAILSEAGSIQMPLAQTFWSPLFAMFQDRFGLGWMLSMPTPQT